MSIGIALLLLMVAAAGAFNGFKPSLDATQATAGQTSQQTQSAPPAGVSVTSTVPELSQSITSSGTITSTTSIASNLTRSTVSEVAQIIYQVTVEARYQNGSAITGMKVNVTGAGKLSTTLATPATFRVLRGTTYSIVVAEGNGLVFDGWSTGAMTRSVSLLATHDTTIVATYKAAGSQTLVVTGKLQNGKSVAGVLVDIYNQGTKVDSDTLPVNFSASYGQTYSVVLNTPTSLAFQYWENNKGMATQNYTLTVTGNTSITAVYQERPLPYTPHGKGNYTVTVVAHTPDGGDLIGMYFQVRIHGVWNHTVNGYTPASVQVPSGTEMIVMYHCTQVPGYCSDKYFVYRYYNDSAHTLTRWTYVNLAGDIVLHSFYEIIPSSQAVHLTIEAMNGGKPIFVDCTCGGPINISQNGTMVAQSLEPYSFWIWKGRNYSVSVGDIPGYYFTQWTTGSTSHTISFRAEPGADGMTQYFAALYVKTSR